MRISELLWEIPHRLTGYDREITADASVVTALGAVRADSIFACCQSPLRNGHRVALSAYSLGCRIFIAAHNAGLPDDATVVLVEDVNDAATQIAARLLGYPARQMTLIGIAGREGKSSAAFYLHALLSAAGRRVAVLCNEGVMSGGKLRRHGNILPDGVGRQHLLAALAKEGTELVVLELGAEAVAEKAFDGMDFAAILVTDAELPSAYFEGLSSLCKRLGFAVLPSGAGFHLSASRVLTYGTGGDLFAEGVTPFVGKRGFGSRFTLCFSDERAAVSLHVPGDFALSTALGTAALALICGLSFAEVAAGLSRFVPWGSLECVCVADGRYIYRDVAYTPERLARVLSVLRGLCRGKLTVVVGSVGGRARERRAGLGRVAAEIADLVYLTADNPDNEDPSAICQEMTAEIDEPWRYVILPDRAAAIRRAVLEMRPQDVLLVAGKAREDTQLIASQELSFDERKIICKSAEEL